MRIETMTVAINVTDDDIEHGEAGNCNECPVAIATERAVEATGPPVVTVSVAGGYVSILDGYGSRWIAEHGDEVEDFIRDFDIYEYEPRDEYEPKPFATTLTFIRQE